MSEQKRPEHQIDGAVRTVIINTALSLAGEIGWANVTLKKIGEKANLAENEVKATFSSEWKILEAFRTRTDLQVANQANPDWSEHAPRDRLFEALMERIEIIEPWKSGLASVASYATKQPLAGLKLIVSLNKSMVTMLNYAEIRTKPPGMLWQSNGLTIIYLLVLRRWFSDDSDDLGPTMAELNEKLIAADRFMTRACSSGKQPNYRSTSSGSVPPK